MIQLRYRLFAAPLVLSLVHLFLQDFLMHMVLGTRLRPLYVEQSYFLFPFLQYSIISVLFLVSYFLGREVDLKEDLLTVIYSLFLGSLIGSLVFFGYHLASSNPFDIANLHWYAVNFSFQVFHGLQMFFTSFTATAIAYLRKKT